VKKTLLFWGVVNEGAIFGIILAIISTQAVSAQVLMSGGTYAQSFDALANTGTANAWADNVTLPGWYAATNLTSVKSGTVTLYNAGTGSLTTGALYSFGDSGSTDRALGSLASGGPGNFAYGVRLTNDTVFANESKFCAYVPPLIKTCADTGCAEIIARMIPKMTPWFTTPQNNRAFFTS
jgi:hypothetical protein